MLQTTASEPQVSITRVFNAPRELVFQAWSDPQHLLRWFAPHGCTIQIIQLDFKTGGKFHMCISNPQFGACWSTGEYREIEASQRIVFSMATADAAGNIVEPASVGHDSEWPRETVVTVTFDADGDQTKLTLHQTVSEALAKRTGAYPSWLQMLDRLAGELELPTT